MICSRISRLTSKNFELTKESEAGKNPGFSPRLFQRRPSRVSSKNNKIITQPDTRNEEMSPSPGNVDRIRGLVAISSLKSLKTINDEEGKSPREENKRVRKFVPQTPRTDKISPNLEKQYWDTPDTADSAKNLKELIEEIKSLKQFCELLEKHNAALI